MILLMVLCIPTFFLMGAALALGGGKIILAAAILLLLWFGLSYLTVIRWLKGTLNAKTIEDRVVLTDLGLPDGQAFQFENPSKIILRVTSKWGKSYWLLSQGFLMGFYSADRVEWRLGQKTMSRSRLWLALHAALWMKSARIGLRTKSGRLQYVLNVAKELVL